MEAHPLCGVVRRPQAGLLKALNLYC